MGVTLADFDLLAHICLSKSLCQRKKIYIYTSMFVYIETGIIEFLSAGISPGTFS
jgi:hypothetical protein